MPYHFGTDDVWERVLQLADECQGNSNSFMVVQPTAEQGGSKPLYVLVHPGDVVQTRGDVEGSAEPQEILDYSADRQDAISDEIRRLTDAGWDFAVLHRFSSSYGFDTHEVSDRYEDAINGIHGRGAVLFGDDLAEAGAWLLREAAAAERPAVLLSGAWSEAGHGCVSMVGTVLENGGAKAHLAATACISPDGKGEEWRPAAGRLRTDEAVHLAERPAAAPSA